MNSVDSPSRKGRPVPVRFETLETSFLEAASAETGLTVAEMVRRSVRLLKRSREREGSFSFAMELAR